MRNYFFQLSWRFCLENTKEPQKTGKFSRNLKLGIHWPYTGVTDTPHYKLLEELSFSVLVRYYVC